MSFKASGTLRSALVLCLTLSATIPPVLSAPTITADASPWIPRSLKSLFEPRAATNKCGGTGLYITNGGSNTQTFKVFEGKWSINADPFGNPITLAPKASGAVTLPVGFIGHIQRGNLLPATWLEFNMVDGAADGDVSLEMGCDGAATIQASVGSGGVLGFSKDINVGAPSDAYFNPKDVPTNFPGTATTATNVLDRTGDTLPAINANTLAYEQSEVTQSEVYLTGGSGTNQAIASDNCLLITFYEGY